MAKALLGYASNADPRVISEMRVLRRRVSDLESQLLRLKAENDALQAAASQDSFFTIDAAATKEPALT